MLSYFLHQFNPKDFRLVMTILVKDEIDIIETNIRTHAHLGVDAFVVMDNNSSDGTTELLQKLQKEFHIMIIHETGSYQQAKWMKKLAKIAKEELHADWVINNDADEFWIPNNHLNLKENLSFKGSVLTVQRYNMVLEEGKPFFESEHFVANPIFYSKQKQLSQENLSIILTKIGPKTIINPHGLLYLRGGNHKALHIANIKDYLRSGYDKTERFHQISIFHYPIRSYQQFEKNIQNRKNLLELNQKISMGPHYRRWVKLYNEGKLKEEFNENILFYPKEMETLKKYHILEKNPKIQHYLKVSQESS